MKSLTTVAISEAELAKILSITHEQLREMRRSKGLPHLRINRYTIRYLPEHVDQILRLFEVRPKVRKSASGLTQGSLARLRTTA